LRTYEVVYVVQPELDEEALTALAESVTQTITGNGGVIVKTEPMGRRRLAYNLGRHSEAHSMLVHAQMERQALAELSRRLKLSEDVLRYLVVRLDELA
jgi:small subunit ribosomal protein S6